MLDEILPQYSEYLYRKESNPIELDEIQLEEAINEAVQIIYITVYFGDNEKPLTPHLFRRKDAIANAACWRVIRRMSLNILTILNAQPQPPESLEEILFYNEPNRS